MEGVVGLSSTLAEAYKAFTDSLPPFAASFINFFLLVVLIVVYAIFIWKFHRFLATKNIFGLDLNKYNKTQNPFFTKLLAGGFYFLEYIIILPFIIFFWFSIFTIFLILLTQNLEVSTILVLSATIVAAVRMTSYYKENLSRDLAKLLPFTLLAVTLLNPGFFNIERIIGNISQIPSFFSQIIHFLIFIIILEVILRLFDFIFSLFGLEEEQIEEKSS